VKLGSLFSGIGGFDLGFERAGFEVAWQCENDKYASAVLAGHWPGVRRIGDVHDINAGDGPVDVLAGGFPCQDVSVAGRRAGLAGERSGLFHEFARVIGDLRPEWVVIENVPGLLSSNSGRDMGTVVGALGELGYGWAYRVLDAQYFGVPQRRRRVFIVACAGGRTGRAAKVLFEPESVCGDPAPRRTAGEDIAGTLGGSSQSGGFRTTDLDNNGAFIVANAITASAGHHGSRGDGSDNLIAIIQDAREVREKAQNGIGITSAGEPMYTLDGTSQHAVAYVPEMIGTISGGAHPGGLNGQDAETQTIAPSGRVRRLTPTECERLQGFPDGWTAGQSDSHRYRQLGNAVAVPVAAWIARRILDSKKGGKP